MSQYDVVIVGAGIHGVGVAQAAAAAGQKVLLLEQSAPAYGTSSRSSKLIHGGLRYLESGQFHLVRESLLERALMLKNAPELVRLKAFHIPLYKDTRRKPWQIALGLSMYAVLGGFKRGCRFGLISRGEWSQLDGLRTGQLKAVFRYYDGQTDDALLTRSVLKSAERLGAEAHIPAKFLHAELHREGVRISYAQVDRTVDVDAKVLVNAGGPWVNHILRLVTPSLPLRLIELVQGTHLVLPGQVTRGIYYVESPRDGRAVFVMPWYGETLIGTTETRYRGDPAEVKPLQTEINYLLQIMRHYFPDRHSRAQDIEHSFAGVRVLPAGSGHAFHRPRETVLDTDRSDKPRLISIFGGKLTGWRATAEQVMQRIAPSLPVREVRADTRHIQLVPE
ncbi:MAG TPA: glycerol-3-phosphate dehydrogenase/oxidase [Steroidobacteraceae bacterium]|nr:glycerol-3-phosphate dehydrogenase/oxidase [Steroidobacteraceae bacterium]